MSPRARPDPGYSSQQHTPEGLQIHDDPITFIRSRPQMFLRSARFTPEEAVEHLIGAALVCGATAVSIERSAGGWWIIWSTQDWLPSGASHSVFQRIVPFPQDGPTSMRPEVLLTAFAADVVTVSGDEMVSIKGLADDVRRTFVARNNRIGRLVAFRV